MQFVLGAAVFASGVICGAALVLAAKKANSEAENDKSDGGFAR